MKIFLFFIFVAVTFYKRAQILIADVWGCFEGEGDGKFNDIEDITMFADYRVPQILNYFKAIEYSSELKEFLAGSKLINSGDTYEVEIRAASIVACHLIKTCVQEILNDSARKAEKAYVINDILVDFYLWNYRVDHAEEINKTCPIHRIRCTFY